MNPLEQIRQWAKTHYPDASNHHISAFINCVTYLMTGASAGIGGPSMREHLVSWSLAGKHGQITTVPMLGTKVTALIKDGSIPDPGDWDLDAALSYCAPLVFGDVSQYRDRLQQIRFQECCFDDDPSDNAFFDRLSIKDVRFLVWHEADPVDKVPRETVTINMRLHTSESDLPAYAGIMIESIGSAISDAWGLPSQIENVAIAPKVFLLRNGDDDVHIIVQHPGGYSAYPLDQAGGTMTPASFNASPEEIAEHLSRLDSDSSVGQECSYTVVPLHS